MLLEKGYDAGETRVRIPMTRLYGNSILTIYIPSLILMIISYLTLFFRTSIFDVRVMVALTALLVLATLFAQVRICLDICQAAIVLELWCIFIRLAPCECSYVCHDKNVAIAFLLT